MSDHQLLVSHEDDLGPGGQQRWRATCACGWVSAFLTSESNADADAREHGIAMTTAMLRAELAAMTVDVARLESVVAEGEKQLSAANARAERADRAAEVWASEVTTQLARVQALEAGQDTEPAGPCACDGAFDDGCPRCTPEPAYPCDRCGKLRTKAEGGTTFTVCDACWDATTPKPEPARSLRAELAAMTVERDALRASVERLTRERDADIARLEATVAEGERQLAAAASALEFELDENAQLRGINVQLAKVRDDNFTALERLRLEQGSAHEALRVAREALMWSDQCIVGAVKAGLLYDCAETTRNRQPMLTAIATIDAALKK